MTVDSEDGGASCTEYPTAAAILFDPPADAERQPLLHGKPAVTPLPKKQLAIMCFCRLAEPVAFTQIFPYMNQMVEELHIARKPADIGFYSGLVDGLFSIAQLLTIFHWGRLSDRLGRKPIILSGLTGVALATAGFGLSTTFWQALVFRAMAGGLTGNIAVLNSSIGDITDETNQARAFPLLDLVWGVGAVLGPLIGGSLAHPAERYPSLFGGYSFLRRHPFFLPGFVSSLITLLSIVVGALFLDETLPRKVKARKSSSFDGVVPATPVEPVPTPESPESGARKPTPTVRELVSNDRVRGVMIFDFFLSFVAVSWQTVFVLFAYTSARLGGLQRNPAQIGYALAAQSAFWIVLCLVVFPDLHRRMGTIPFFRACMAVWPLTFVLFSATSLFARHALTSGERDGSQGTSASTSGGIWIGVTLILLSGQIACMAFSAIWIALKKAAPDPESMGAIFGLSHVAGDIARGVGPVFVSSLFALSIDTQLLGAQFVWVVMFCIAVVGYLFTRRL